MLNTVLLSFFFAAPAVVAVVTSSGFKNPLARLIFFWGGCLFTFLAALFLAPMYLCGGSLLSGYTSCVALGGIFTEPVLMGAAYAYVLGGPALALIGYLAELVHTRRSARG